MSRVAMPRSGRSDVCLPAAEARLLITINKGMSEAWWTHYHRLVEKRQASKLSRAEHKELIQLTDELEQEEAIRLKALVKLAKLRKQSLTEVMAALGIGRSGDE
jgi:hypothetical protein